MAVAILTLLHVTSIYNEDIYRVNSENYIDNTCEFNTIRIRRNQVICNDYGINVKYCDHYTIPEEFTIVKEIGVGNSDVFTIKPYGMYEEYNNRKRLLANFYYNFKCNHLDNEPQLFLRIIPKNDKATETTIIETIFLAIVFITVFSSLMCICPGDFITGFILGSLSNRGERRIYCE